MFWYGTRLKDEVRKRRRNKEEKKREESEIAGEYARR
jgi:hypothetical protein